VGGGGGWGGVVGWWAGVVVFFGWLRGGGVGESGGGLVGEVFCWFTLRTKPLIPSREPFSEKRGQGELKNLKEDIRSATENSNGVAKTKSWRGSARVYLGGAWTPEEKNQRARRKERCLCST